MLIEVLLIALTACCATPQQMILLTSASYSAIIGCRSSFSHCPFLQSPGTYALQLCRYSTTQNTAVSVTNNAFATVLLHAGLHFRLLTGSFLSHLLISQGINKRTITTTLLSLLLMASQDLVATQNHGRFSSIQQVLVQYKLLPSSSISHIPQQQQHQQLAAQKITLHVQGMRCEACAARLKGNLAALDGVDGCSVHFQTKQVDIWSNSSAAVQPEVLLEAVRATDDSYDVRIVSQDCYNTANDKIACPDVKGAATHQH